MNWAKPLRRVLRPFRALFDRAITSRRFMAYQAGAMDRCLARVDRAGVFDGHDHILLRRHYYLPLPDERDMASIRETELIGCSINEEACFGFHSEHVARFNHEFREFPLHSAGKNGDFHVVNGSFMAIDGNMYYGLIRALAPKRIIEVGSGSSTKLACAAIRRNLAEGRRATQFTCIEPFHSDALDGLKEVSEILRNYVQDVDLGVFEQLESGDILFIDSTHTVRPGGDVWWEFCEILPRLKSGVLVHIHDVSLPKPYPDQTLRNHWYWMEQYMLQTFLTFNNKYSVVWAGNFLMLRCPEKMIELFGTEYSAMRSVYPHAEPASFWMRVG